MSTKIQWTDETWNPVAGCRKVSAGCDHCYAIRDAHRLAGNPNPAIAAVYAGLTRVQNGRLNWTGTFRELPERLDQPLRWTRPRRIFVNSLSDLFGEGISDEYIDQVFAVMALARDHQFQVLTKRPDRMRDYLTALPLQARQALIGQHFIHLKPHAGPVYEWPGVPLPNVWLGTSVEDQKAAEARIPALLETPAAVRFLSCEPLLGPVDLKPFLCSMCGGSGLYSPHEWTRPCPQCRGSHYGGEDRPRLHWVIAGGESGPDARPCELRWLRELRDQCREARIRLFVKQLGSVWAQEHGATSRKAGDINEWPEDLRIREYPAKLGEPEERS